MSGQLQTKSALNFESKSSYSVTVSVSDGKNLDGNPHGGVDDTIAVTVTVTDVNEAPEVVGRTSIRYAEDRTDPVGRYSALDPERETVTWSLSGPDQDDFTITDGVIEFASGPDYESAADSDTNNEYLVTVRAFDGQLAGTLDVAVTVTNANDPPTVTGPTSIAYLENGTDPVATYRATDPEGTTIFWSLLGPDQNDFSITNGELRFRHAPNFESATDSNRDNEYLVTVRASDGQLAGTVDVEVTVSDVNEPPSVTGRNPVDYAENRTDPVASYSATDPEQASIDWSLSGRDRDDFTINGGELRFASTPDHEAATDSDTDNEYLVTLRAFDGGETGTYDVTVNVTDVDEAPEVTGDARVTIEENSTDYVGRYVAADPEEEPSSWEALSGPDRGHFEISDTGALTFQSEPDFDARADANRDNDYEVTVRASAGGKTGTLDVTVTVTDLDEPPVVTGPEARDYRENATTSVATYRASDPEEAPVEWSLSGDDQSHFAISRGALSFDEPPDYDARADSDGNNDYEVTVEASDGSFSGRLDVTVTVTDVNEPPQITPAADIAVDENHDGTLAAFSARDPENEPGLTYTWSLAGTDAGDFNLSEAGVLAFKHIPDADNPADSGRDNVYDITVRALDSAGMRGSIDITVTVRPVNEPPVISGDATPGIKEEGSLLVGTYRASDPESATIAWQPLTGADSGQFEFTSSNGRLAFKAAPDYEQATDSGRNNVYDVTLGVSAGGHITTLDIAVSVTNEEEPGTLGLSSEQPLAGTVLTATLADPDGVLSESWSWQRSPNRSTWSEIGGAASERYTPVDADLNHYLRVTVDYTDGHGPDKRVQETADDRVEEPPPVNYPPVFPGATAERSVAENAAEGTPVGDPVSATDANNDTLSYTLDAAPFTIDGDGQIRVARGAALDYEAGTLYVVTVTATDPSNALAIILVSISVTDVNEAPEAADDSATTDEDKELTIDVIANDRDPENDDLTVSLRNRPRNGSATVETDNTVSYTPNANYHGADSFTYSISDSRLSSGQATVAVTIDPVNDAPAFPSATVERTVSESAGEGDNVGAPVTATDVDTGDTLMHSLSGTDAGFFDIVPDSGQITVGGGTTFDIAIKDTYELTVTAADGNGGRATVELTITVTAGPTPGPGPGPTGGGGGPSGPSPSEFDFEWTVKHDIEALAAANAAATGAWSDGETLWVANNPDGAGDGVYAYDLETGERAEEREFELDEANRAPRGLWSDGTVIWVSDSGRDKLFAHDLASGERLAGSDLTLHPDNDDPRGIWSGGETMWVLDGRDDALFAYDLASGELLAECALDPANSDPRGLWSDGVTIWVSDHGAKRLFAYWLPLLPEKAEDSDVEDADADEKELERVLDEEFGESRELSKASNNSPRGVWSDGDVMYVVDASDGKVYTYNMPDAIDARLASLTLGGVEIGEFSPDREEYEAVVAEDVTETTVAAEAMQRRTTVVIEPPDAGEEAEGHQVALEGVEAITVTVTSADDSRTRTYRVRFPETGWDPARDPWPHCLRGAVAEGFSLVVFAGGSVDDLAACAESREIVAFYALREGVYVSYLLAAPDFVNRAFRELFGDGLPLMTALVAGSNGPPSADPFGDDLAAAGQPWPHCLRGEVAEGFSVVVFEGGGVDDLVACAAERGVSALYTLHEGEWLSYLLGAPEFVNQPFRELFPHGLPALTPLVVKSDAVPAAN